MRVKLRKWPCEYCLILVGGTTDRVCNGYDMIIGPIIVIADMIIILIESNHTDHAGPTF